MKLAAAILAASAMGPAPRASEPPQVPWAQMASGEAVRCDNEAGCIVFSREAFEQVLEGAIADGVAKAPCRRLPNI